MILLHVSFFDNETFIFRKYINLRKILDFEVF
jgi:hypothetical protein